MILKFTKNEPTFDDLVSYAEYLEKIVDEQRTIIEAYKELSAIEKQSSMPQMLTILDVVNITGWSKRRVEQLFDDPSLNVVHIGKSKQVEASVLKKYLCQKHDAENDRYWRLLSAREKTKSKAKSQKNAA